MLGNKLACCRCGDYGCDDGWSSAPFIPEQYWLCPQCMNAVLLIWVLEHQSMIEELATREVAERGRTGPA